MTRRLAVLAVVAVTTIGLGACKGDRKLTTYNLSHDAGYAAGYEGGTPITLADGTFVTLPDGTKVTTPKLSDTNGSDDETTTTIDVGSGGATVPTYLVTTGTTTRQPSPSDALAFPTPGVYQFHDAVTPDDGSPGVDHDTYFQLSATAERTIRVEETDQDGATKSKGAYEERHDDDGLWLVGSALTGGVCRWSPKSASLPRRVVEGGSVTTAATCEANDVTLRLETKVSFKVIRDVTIAGRSFRALDVTRHRVLTDGTSTITSDAVDTYAFALGMRVALSEHTSNETDTGITGFTRNLVLQSLPS